MNAPVVLFVYNRLDHTMNVIESLSKNLMADQTDLYVFSDAALTFDIRFVQNYLENVDCMCCIAEMMFSCSDNIKIKVLIQRNQNGNR